MPVPTDDSVLCLVTFSTASLPSNSDAGTRGRLPFRSSGFSSVGSLSHAGDNESHAHWRRRASCSHETQLWWSSPSRFRGVWTGRFVVRGTAGSLPWHNRVDTPARLDRSTDLAGGSTAPHSPSFPHSRHHRCRDERRGSGSRRRTAYAEERPTQKSASPGSADACSIQPRRRSSSISSSS